MTAVPKYQAIYRVLRQRILDGELRAGSKLAPQQDLADQFGVTLMTLRQAVSALESDGLVWAARGKGTFVADRPVDVSVGNLSSFAAQMQREGVDLETEVLDIRVVEFTDAASALGLSGPLNRITRRRLVKSVPVSLQRSYLSLDLQVRAKGLAKGSLYDLIEAETGWSVTSAEESISAVGLNDEDADLLGASPGQPALRSVRTSINQFDQPFLYDEALLVGDRCSITANRTSDRLSLSYGPAE